MTIADRSCAKKGVRKRGHCLRLGGTGVVIKKNSRPRKFWVGGEPLIGQKEKEGRKVDVFNKTGDLKFRKSTTLDSGGPTRVGIAYEMRKS